MNEVQLLAESGSDNWSVASVRHFATPSRPDVWQLTLVRGPHAPPAVGSKVLIAPGGVSQGTSLSVLSAPAGSAGERYRVTATRLPVDVLGTTVAPLLQGPADQIVRDLGTWWDISTNATSALQRVSLHTLRRPDWLPDYPGETVGQFVRWLTRHLAAERGVIVRLAMDDAGRSLLSDPLTDPPHKPDPVTEPRHVRHGGKDPLNPRKVASSRQRWVRGTPADGLGWANVWPEWLEAAAVIGSGRSVVRRFEAVWMPPGAVSVRRRRSVTHDGSVKFIRRWADKTTYVESMRRRVRPSGWSAVARMKDLLREGDKLWVTVSPLTWFPGEENLAPCCTKQVLKCRLAAPYAGGGSVDGMKPDCGVWTVPEKEALVWVAAPSAFHEPVVLGDIRYAPPSEAAFGVYLAADKTWATKAAQFVVSANSTFDPP